MAPDKLFLIDSEFDCHRLFLIKLITLNMLQKVASNRLLACHVECPVVCCIRIRTRGGIYGKIWPEPEGLPEGNPKGSGLILSYIMT